METFRMSRKREYSTYQLLSKPYKTNHAHLTFTNQQLIDILNRDFAIVVKNVFSNIL